MKWMMHLLFGISLYASSGCQPPPATGGCISNDDCAPGLACDLTASVCTDRMSVPTTVMPTAPSMNRPPIIEMLLASATDVAPSHKANLKVTAFDPDGDSLTYVWQASSGSLTEQDNTMEWTAPDVYGEATLKVTVKDGRGGKAVAQQVMSIALARILIDGTKDGGAWWYPQGGPFVPSQPHQGKALADRLRALGYAVDEMGRDEAITPGLLQRYSKVIRPSAYFQYQESELRAYEEFTKRTTTLLLFSTSSRLGEPDVLAERLGISLINNAKGTVSRFATHPITQGVFSLPYRNGRALLDPARNPAITVLGWLSDADYIDLNGNNMKDANEPSGMAVMGILDKSPSRIFFLSDLLGIESVPQPFVDNLIRWAF